MGLPRSPWHPGLCLLPCPVLCTLEARLQDTSSCGARGGFLPRHDEDLREEKPGGLPSMGSHRVGHD